MVLFLFTAQYPHYLAGGANPHDLQAAAAAAGAYGALHNNLPPAAALNSYPRPALVSRLEMITIIMMVYNSNINIVPILQVGYDPHAQMRAPLGPGLGIPGGKP